MARILDLALAALLAAAPVAVHGQTTAAPPAPAEAEGGAAAPALAEGNPLEAERRGLTSEEVVETLDTQPTEQGLRGTQPIGDPDEAEARGLTSEAVEETVDQEPTQQGNRPENVVEGEEEIAPQEASLYERLARVRAAPPGLDGEPIPRPNPLASEPTTEMDPVQPDNASLFVEGYVE